LGKQQQNSFGKEEQMVMEQQEESLDKMSSLLKSLQEMGQDMNCELEGQLQDLDKLDDSVSKQNKRLQNTNRKIVNLL